MTQMHKSKGLQCFPEGIQDLERACESPLSLKEHSLTVGWGDCDPAQIAYTARVPEWSLSAIEDWYRYCLGVDWYDINLRRGIGTPFVSLNCDFHSPVTPRYILHTKTYVSSLGNSSLSHRVEAFQNDVLCFTTKTTAVFVDAQEMKPISIPPNMRRNIENYIKYQERRFEKSSNV